LTYTNWFADIRVFTTGPLGEGNQAQDIGRGTPHAHREDGHDPLFPELLEEPGKDSRAIEHIPEV
jgi:hypothetical protein